MYLIKSIIMKADPYHDSLGRFTFAPGNYYHKDHAPVGDGKFTHNSVHANIAIYHAKAKLLPAQTLAKTTGDIRKVMEAWAVPYGIEATTDGSHFDRSNNTIRISARDFDKSNQYRAFLHEFAHLIDARSQKQTDDPNQVHVGNLSYSKAFREAFVSDAGKIIATHGKIESMTALLRSSDWIENGVMQDLFSCLTKERVKVTFGHEAQYYQATGKRETEVFSDIFAVIGSNEAREIDLLKKETPELLREFRKIIRKLT